MENADEPTVDANVLFYYERSRQIELVPDERYIAIDMQRASSVLTAGRIDELKTTGDALLGGLVLLERTDLSAIELAALQATPALRPVYPWPNGTLQILLHVNALLRSGTTRDDLMADLERLEAPAVHDEERRSDELRLTVVSGRNEDLAKVLRLLSGDDMRKKVIASPSCMTLGSPPLAPL